MLLTMQILMVCGRDFVNIMSFLTEYNRHCQYDPVYNESGDDDGIDGDGDGSDGDGVDGDGIDGDSDGVPARSSPIISLRNHSNDLDKTNISFVFWHLSSNRNSDHQQH